MKTNEPITPLSPLSPTARAVLDSTMGLAATVREAQAVAAAALRAAADQVVPESREHHPVTLDEKHRKVSVFNVRNRLLDIAAELDSL